MGTPNGNTPGVAAACAAPRAELRLPAKFLRHLAQRGIFADGDFGSITIRELKVEKHLRGKEIRMLARAYADRKTGHSP